MTSVEPLLFSDDPSTFIWFYLSPLLDILVICFSVLLFRQTKKFGWLLIPMGLISPYLIYWKSYSILLARLTWHPVKTLDQSNGGITWHVDTTINLMGLFLVLTLIWFYFDNLKSSISSESE